MSRYINPIPQYFTNDGKVLSGGKLYFYKSGTSDPLDTFADSALTIINPNPIILTAAGRTPNVFYEGSAKVKITDSSDITITELDPVGGEQTAGEWGLWNAFIVYEKGAIVRGADDKFYISIADSNSNNNPTTPSPTYWTEIKNLKVWNTNESYAIGDVVQDSAGSLWKSLINGNIANNPTSDSGTNWIPAISGAKVPEVATLETRTTTAILQVGGGTLSALRLNRLSDSSTYTLPLANSVSANQWLDVTLPNEFSAFTPTVQRGGSDTITDSVGTDTSILFDSGAITIRLVSDGVSDWSLDL